MANTRSAPLILMLALAFATADLQPARAASRSRPALLELRGGASPAAKQAPTFAAAMPSAAVCAANGLALAGFLGTDNFASAGTAASLITCAGLTACGVYKPYMIGVHVALLLQATAVGVCGARAAHAVWNGGAAEKWALACASCIAGLGGLKLAKPKKAQSA